MSAHLDRSTSDTHSLPSDDDLARRTRMLLEAAENISLELSKQTERLASTIDIFNRDVVTPLRSLTKEEIAERDRHKEKH